MIPVTKTFLPPLHEYNSYLERIWESAWITNRGKLVLELEEKLKSFLNVSNILITNNGTVPIQIALKLLGKGGEIITTPFSFIATASAIVWENCTPVFVDIHPDYLTIDESQIEAAITKNTTCILATHVFGNPCHVDAIESIAKKYNLSVIYDAAHCFDVAYNGRSIFEYGDVSTCSFHATKLFHTGEGGAIFCSDKTLHEKIFYSHNFGFNGPIKFHGLGINAKISELQAAMGLAVLPYTRENIQQRKKVKACYDEQLDFSVLSTIKIREHTDWNASYYPVIFKSEEVLLNTQAVLNQHHIFPRRYFYPSLNTVHYMQGQSMPVSESIASRILCLPMYDSIQSFELEHIIKIVNNEN